MKIVGNYLATDDGTPIFLVGSYDYSPIHLGEAFWVPWLTDMKNKANYVRIGVSGIKGNKVNPYIEIGGKFDLTKYNSAFFKQLKKFLKMANESGIYVHVSLFNEIFIKDKSGCGFPRNPFGNGNHVNQALVGDVDRNHNNSGMESNEFYDLTALNGATADKQRLAVAKLQKDFVTKVVTIGNAFPNVFFEVGNENSDMNWVQYWANFISGITTNPVTVNSPSMGYKSVSPNKGLTYHRIDYHFAEGQGVVRGLDSDGAGINPADSDLNRNIAWKSLTSGFGIYANYAELILRKSTPDGWAYSGSRSFLDQCYYFDILLEILSKTKARLGVMTPHPEVAGGRPCISKLGKQYLVYSDGALSCTVDLTKYVGQFRVQVYNHSSGAMVSDKKVSAGSIVIPTVVGQVVFIKKLV